MISFNPTVLKSAGALLVPKVGAVSRYHSGAPSGLVDAFRLYYGPTMNAFEAAEKNGRAQELRKELEALFQSQNKAQDKDKTSIPATFLRVTVAVG